MFERFGIKETVKIVTLPKGRNQILLRIENIGDIYDKNPKTPKPHHKIIYI